MVNGYGKADASRHLHAVYTNGLAVQIDQRPARVSKCNGRIRLDVLNAFAW